MHRGRLFVTQQAKQGIAAQTGSKVKANRGNLRAPGAVVNGNGREPEPLGGSSQVCRAGKHLEKELGWARDGQGGRGG